MFQGSNTIYLDGNIRKIAYDIISWTNGKPNGPMWMLQDFNQTVSIFYPGFTAVWLLEFKVLCLNPCYIKIFTIHILEHKCYVSFMRIVKTMRTCCKLMEYIDIDQGFVSRFHLFSFWDIGVLNCTGMCRNINLKLMHLDFFIHTCLLTHTQSIILLLCERRHPIFG